MKDNWIKNKKSDNIWWLDNGVELTGEFVFSFDKEHAFNLFADYPYRLTAKQKELFDSENPYWADFFKDRK